MATNCFAVISDNTASGNTYNGIRVEDVSLNGTWYKNSLLNSLPYIVSSDTEIGVNATLTIEPGVVVKFQNGGACIDVHGTLIADGTPTDKIVFTSLKDDEYGGDTNSDGGASTPSKDDWNYIYFGDTSENSVIDNAIVKYAGYTGNPGIWITSADVPITNSIISDIGARGIYLSDSSPDITGNTISNISGDGIDLRNSYANITGNTISNNSGYGIYCRSQSNPNISNNVFTNNYGVVYLATNCFAVISDNTASGNTYNGIRVEDVSLNGTWYKNSLLNSLPYIVSSDTEIGVNATLTIEPGVVVKFQNGGACIDVHGTLIADGTPTDKIVFTSLKDDEYGGDTNSDGGASTPSKDDWNYIYFGDTSENSVIDNAIVKYAGYTGNPGIWITSADVPITNSIISDIGARGIYLSDSSPDITGNTISNISGDGIDLRNSYANITGNTISNNSGYGIYCRSQSNPNISNNVFTNNYGVVYLATNCFAVISDNTASGNTYNGIRVEDVSLNGTWYKNSLLNSLPYIVSSDTEIGVNATLTIEPGVVVKFQNGGACIDVHGTLIADGTPTDKIVFTSLKDDEYGGDTNSDGGASTPSKDDWNYIYFGDTSENSVIDNAIVKYAGYTGNPGIWITSADVPITNSIISDIGARGIYLSDSSPDITGNTISNISGDGIDLRNSYANITGNTISNNSGYGIYCRSQSNPNISNNVFTNNYGVVYLATNCFVVISDNTASGNTYNGIRVEDVSLNGTWYKNSLLNSLPYIVSSDTEIGVNATLTIEPGVVVKFQNGGACIDVHGTLIADGTPTDKIVFTSLKDDEYGGDTNSDGGASTPSKDDWNYIYFGDTSENSVIDNAIVKYAGYTGNPGIWITSADVPITNSIISDIGARGIYLSDSSPDITGNTISNNSGDGIDCRGQSNPNINYNNICDNTNYGVRNADSSLTINAENNWWGDASGPLDDSDDTATGGFYNPDGLGDRVSDYVDYSPWADEPVIVPDTYPPTANANGPYSGNVNEDIQFYGKGTDPDGDAIVAYAWDFNNDAIIDSTLQNPTHSWPSAGTYHPALKVQDEREAWSEWDWCEVNVYGLVPHLGPYPRSADDKYYVRVFNIDDIGKVYVNGELATSVNFGQDNLVDITGDLHLGENEINLTVKNLGEGYTWGFEIRHKYGSFGVCEMIWDDSCGEVGVYGCNDNEQTGEKIVYEKKIILELEEREFSDFSFVQLTDVHIGWDQKTLPGLQVPNTVKSLRRFAIALEEVKELNPDFILITGDLVEWNNPTFFMAFNGILESVDIPSRFIPGNHDRRTLLLGDDALAEYHKYINPSGVDNYCFEEGEYLFIGLDSGKDLHLVDLHPEGSGLSEEQINYLYSAAIGHRGPKVVFMHHPAINDKRSVHMPWDYAPGGNSQCIGNNRYGFISYCNAYSNVQLVLTGHTHEQKIFKVLDDTAKDANAEDEHRPLFIQTLSATKKHEGSGPGLGYIEVNKNKATYESKGFTTFPKRVITSITGILTPHAYDSEGRHTGWNDAAGYVERNIPGSYHTGTYEGTFPTLDTTQVLVLFEDDHYKIDFTLTPLKIKGKEDDEAFSSEISIRAYDEDTFTDSYYNVSITQSGTASIVLNQTVVNYTMEIDYDGDGEIDGYQSPDTTETNYAPTATIISPGNNSIFVHGDEITFSGTGTDPEEGVLTDLSLVWSSDIYGIIGVGNEFSTFNLSAGTHRISLRVNDSAELSGLDSIEITVHAPDITLNSADISFANPTEGEIIPINVTVHNIGFVNAANVTVHIFDGFPEFQISNLTVNSIPVGESRTVNATWNTTGKIGNHTISVMIDPDDLIEEMNETDNKASRFIVVEIVEPSPCFIATAAYGTPLHEDINVLRDFRDQYLMPNPAGRTFVKIYYSTSPPLAEVIRENEGLRTAVRAGFVKPLVYITRRVV